MRDAFDRKVEALTAFAVERSGNLRWVYRQNEHRAEVTKPNRLVLVLQRTPQGGRVDPVAWTPGRVNPGLERLAPAAALIDASLAIPFTFTVLVADGMALAGHDAAPDNPYAVITLAL